MINRLSFIAIFLGGVISGWLGKSWYEPVQLEKTGDYQDTANRDNRVSPNSTRTPQSTSAGISDSRPAQQEIFGAQPLQEGQNAAVRSTAVSGTAVSGTPASASAVSGLEAIKRLLSERAYNDAMILYQEQVQQNEQTATQLKRVIFDELKVLSETRNNTDFSELTESYLSIYYDDVDILLLLADFNQANGSYLEVVDVYLLAKTYAYSEADLKNVLTRFDRFVEEIDASYTNQKNWLALMNLYAHINSSGLMTSPYQYRQALAHLRSGDEYFAVEQFNLLLNDSLMGESAASALNSLSSDAEAPAIISSFEREEESESIALQKLGNQYSVSLTGNHQQSVKLLIDTGASMTTLSSASFDSINANGDAQELERRVFRTAGGVVMGTVYSVPELSLGPYLLRNTLIAVLDFDTDREIDGLLGMNILGQFRFQIDQDNNQLLLSKEQ